MRLEVKNYWLVGLKSGTYKQGKHLLRSLDNTYCIIGVLADLSVIYGGVTRTQDKESYLYDGYKFCLPPKTVEWAKMHNSHGHTRFIGKSFSDMNDNNVPWKDMIKLVEEHWENI